MVGDMLLITLLIEIYLSKSSNDWFSVTNLHVPFVLFIS